FIAASTPQPLSIVNSATVHAQFGYHAVGGVPGIPLTALGGAPPYVWSLDSGSLPDGVSLQARGETLSAHFVPGVSYLSGRPHRPGAFRFSLRVRDATGASATRAFTWYITPLNFLYFSLPIAGNPLVYNTPYVQPLLVIGGTNSYTWSTLTPMVPGLALDSTS